jgi:hypothetical protein
VVAANGYPKASPGGTNDQVEEIAHALVVFMQGSDLILWVAPKGVTSETAKVRVLDQSKVHKQQAVQFLNVCPSRGGELGYLDV